MRRQYLLAFFCGFVLGIAGCYWATRGDHQDRSDSTDGQQSSTVVQNLTSVSAVPKDSPESPDVIVSQQYVAVVNGEKVSVPIVPQKPNGTTGKPNSPTGSNGNQTQGIIKQEIDLSPLILSQIPRWEIGTGYMYLDKKHYGCVSIQRNYKKDKALEVTYVTDRKTKGAMIQHKWTF